MRIVDRLKGVFRGRAGAARHVVTAGALVLAAFHQAPARAEIVEAVPRFLVETRAVAPSGEPVIRAFRPSDSPALGAALPAFRAMRMTLRAEVLDTAQVDRPVRVALQVLDANGEPATRFDEPVTFECALGVVPILATARWTNGAMVETVIFTRPGRNARLGVTAGDATVAAFLDVAPPPLDRAAWIRIAEEHLAADRFPDALRAFTNAAALVRGGDAEIENRLGRLYLQRGQWREAELHFRNAVRASMTATP